MRSLGVEEWVVPAVQRMYATARSRLRVNGQYSEKFEVKVDVHQGSVLSPMLFILVLETLSREFRIGVTWELLYVDDLIMVVCLRVWRAGMEQKGLRVNLKKTKFLISVPGLDVLKDSGKFPCTVCRKGVGANYILCSRYRLWVHKKCSGIQGRLSADPECV